MRAKERCWSERVNNVSVEPGGIGADCIGGTKYRPKLRILSIAIVAMIAIAFSVESTGVAAAQSLTSGGQTEGAAALNGSSPDVIPGFYLTFTCTHGGIFLNGSSYCQHQQTTQDICDSSSCEFQLDGYPDFGYSFVSWETSDVTVGCSTCAQTTLTVHVPNPGQRYSGTLTLNAVSDFVTVTVDTFVNWSDNGWVPGHVQACMYLVGCMNASNGQDLTLLPPYQYTITADLSPLFYVEEWLTTAGSLTSSTSNPTLFTPNGSGTLYLIALDEHTQGGWVGYIYSISGLTGEVTSISGTFILPTATEMGFGIWMGIGGMTGTDLWQAGVQVNKSGTVAPWYEAYVPGGNQTVEYGHSFPIALGDKVEVTVTSDGGICTFAIQDLSRPGQPTWSGHDVNKFYPNAQTGEWIMEPKTTPSSQLDIPVSNMTFNGGFSVYASYMDIEYTWGTSQGGYLDYYGSALVAGYPNFSIESSG